MKRNHLRIRKTSLVLIAAIVAVFVYASQASAQSVFYNTAPMRALNDATRTVVLKQHPNETVGWTTSCGLAGFAPREQGACLIDFRVGPPGNAKRLVQPVSYQESPGRCSFQLRLLGDLQFNARTTTKRGTCLRIRAVVETASQKGTP